jgi:hypothetical protein
MTDFSLSRPSNGSMNSSQTTQNSSYVDDYLPPRSMGSATPTSIPASMPTTNPSPTKASQTLEDQNIFHLLGVEDATEDEKEAFLDELQQVIWEDFLENDVDLLLTEEELAEFKKIADKPGLSEEDRQGEMVTFLEKLIPDLEKIMLEKALELKEEMMRERINQLLSQYKEMPEKVAQVHKALQFVDDQQWRSAAETLNAMSS